MMIWQIAIASRGLKHVMVFRFSIRLRSTYLNSAVVDLLRLKQMWAIRGFLPTPERIMKRRHHSLKTLFLLVRIKRCENEA